MKNHLFFLIFFFSFSGLSAQISKKNHNVNIAIRNLKNDEGFKHASIAFFVRDINSGEVISSFNSNLSLAPASTQKLITTATALEILGNHYKFKTRLEYTGKLDKNTGILDGNIIIKGGGDPSLGSKYFSQTNFQNLLDTWARACYKAGIKYIDGKIIADARFYGYQTVPPKWSWEDMGNYFGAAPSGLSIHDNLYSLFFNTSPLNGGKTEIVKIEPEIPGLQFHNHVKSDAVHSDLSYIFGAPYTYERYVEGRLPLNRKNYEVKGSLPDPALFAAQNLKKKLKENGIASGKASTFRLSPDEGKNDSLPHILLYTTYSPELNEIIKITNFKSINLFAEHFYKQSQIYIADFNLKKISQNFINYFWQSKGLDTQGMFLFDGSGLSRYNALTAKQMVFILIYMKLKSRNADVFYNSIPFAGEEGTVKNMCQNTSAEGNMKVKSGSVRNVRAYAGYVKSKSGRELAFSIFSNNFDCSSSAARKKIEKVLIALAEFNL